MRIFIAIATILFVLMAPAGPALAQYCSPVATTPSAEDPIRLYNSDNYIGQYNRPGTCNETWSIGVSGELAAQCNNNGNWRKFDNRSDNGLCYTAGSCSVSCSCACGCSSSRVSTGYRTEGLNTNTGDCFAQADWDDTRVLASQDLRISQQPCSNDVCITERRDAPGSNMFDNTINEISYNTGDPMYALSELSDADGYIDMVTGLGGEPGPGAYWIHRKGGPNKPLMIPTKGKDFRSFAEGYQGNNVRIENACRPTSFSQRCPRSPSCSCDCINKDCRNINCRQECTTDEDGNESCSRECDRVCKCPSAW